MSRMASTVAVASEERSPDPDPLASRLFHSAGHGVLKIGSAGIRQLEAK